MLLINSRFVDNSDKYSLLLFYLKHLGSVDLKMAYGESISKHISFPEKISSHLRGLINLARIFQQYRRTYVNYWMILSNISKKRYPIKAVLRNGSPIVLNSFFHSYTIAQLYGQKGVEYDTISDTVKVLDISHVTNSKADLRLYGALSNGEVANIFVDNVYNVLPVEGKIVIDIGANIADSAIYFVHRAAKRVIGVEPMPKNIEIAKKNIEINNLSDKISIVLASCSTNAGYVNIDSGLDTGIGSQIQDKNIEQGTTVPQVTLDDLLKEHKTQREMTVLKMDCEGCEYGVILSASDDVLKCFSDILIEYHYGPNDLIKRLENCGFEVSLLNLSGKPGGATTVPDPERIRSWYYMGYVYAKQKK